MQINWMIKDYNMKTVFKDSTLANLSLQDNLGTCRFKLW